MTLPLRNQRTLARRATVAGFGYWSGQDNRLEFRPAPPDTGVVFVRDDLPGKPATPAHVSFCAEASRRTNLALGRAAVEMVEHVLAALAGLQIDNCEVWCTAREMPGCDGSSLAFVEAIQAAGVCEQDAPRQRLAPSEPIRVGDERSWVEARPLKNDHGSLHVRYELDYGAGGPIGRQVFELTVTPDAFAAELAPARTFVLAEEAQALTAQGLGQRVGSGDLLVFEREGLVGNTLRFADECVRHKTLDLVGDLALIGCDLAAEVVAYRSGHRLNGQLAAALLSQRRKLIPSRAA